MAARKPAKKKKTAPKAKSSYKPKGALGSGARFKAVMAAAKKGGAKNPAAVAAMAGRKKYGAAKMAKLSAAGRKRAAGRKK